jgi:hypothetical protein
MTTCAHCTQSHKFIGNDIRVSSLNQILQQGGKKKEKERKSKRGGNGGRTKGGALTTLSRKEGGPLPPQGAPTLSLENAITPPQGGTWGPGGSRMEHDSSRRGWLRYHWYRTSLPLRAKNATCAQFKNCWQLHIRSMGSGGYLCNSNTEWC